MPRKSMSLLCVAILASAGCAHKHSRSSAFIAVDDAETKEYSQLRAYYGVAGNSSSLNAPMEVGRGGGYGTVFAASRYVAVRHKLEIVEPGSGLAKSIEAVVTYCGTIQCELRTSSVTNETAVLSPAGNISARVATQDLTKFLDFVGKQGKVSQHSTESEDKTAAVVDVEAKIKNQTDFRDSLRRMLAKPGVSVADLLQIQEKLAEAQAELDSEATQRKILANETEKVLVEIGFRSEQRTTSRSAFAPVGQALRDFGSVLSDSLAALITAIAAIIPWLIVIVPGIWFLVQAARRLRQRRAERKAKALP
jgi:uncharacterized protein DUF4349